MKWQAFANLSLHCVGGQGAPIAQCGLYKDVYLRRLAFLTQSEQSARNLVARATCNHSLIHTNLLLGSTAHEVSLQAPMAFTAAFTALCARPQFDRDRNNLNRVPVRRHLITICFCMCIYIYMYTLSAYDMCIYTCTDTHLGCGSNPVLSRGPRPLCYKPLSRPAVSNHLSRVSRGYE